MANNATSANRAGAVAEAQKAKKKPPKSLQSWGVTPIPQREPAPTVVDPFKPGSIVKNPLRSA
jgi:hypothetical protein